MSKNFSGIYDFYQIGDFTINYTFLEKALTEQAINEGLLTLQEFITIDKVGLNEEDQTLDFSCKIYRYLDN